MAARYRLDEPAGTEDEGAGASVAKEGARE
jgi:hypothetical protein